MLRKSLLLSISIVVLLSFVGCGYKKKVEGKFAEKVTQGILNKVAGEDVDIDLDSEGGGVKVNVDGEEAVSFGTAEWPKGKAAELIPQFDKGKITYAMNTNDMVMIMVEGVELEEFEEYYKSVQSHGFTEESGEMATEASKSYFAGNKDGNSTCSLSYTPENKGMMITVSVED